MQNSWARTVSFSIIVTGAVLCLACAVATMIAPSETYVNAYVAYNSAVNPFQESGSILMFELGKLVALSDSMTAYGLSKVAGLAVGVGIEFLSVEIDRAMNYDTYRAEIVASIEEYRSDLLVAIS